jgi:hypothetical protein
MNKNEFLTKYPNKMTLGQFEKAALTEKAIDWDGAFGAQCVDLMRFYAHCVMGIPQPSGVSGAQDFFKNYQKDKVLADHFDKIANTPEFVPEPGDIAFWWDDKFGHVAVVTGPSDTKVFTTLDQNYVKNTVTKQAHNYKNFLGVLRPKKHI